MTSPFGLLLRIEAAFGGEWGRSTVGHLWITGFEGDMTKATYRRVYLFECIPEAPDNPNFFRSERRAEGTIALLIGSIRDL